MLALPDSDSSAEAAASWSRGTIRGTEASSDGRCRAARAIVAAASAYSGHTAGRGSAALMASSTAMPPSPASNQRASRRRSSRSASTPPYRPNSTSGTSSAAPSSPTSTGEPVSRLACTSSATSVAWLPARVIVRLANRTRKSPDVRNGRRSMCSPGARVLPVVMPISEPGRKRKLVRGPRGAGRRQPAAEKPGLMAG